jgi:hypothetical protein
MKRLVLLLCCFISFIAAAQQINEPFTFPIKPGTKEWGDLKTETDRFRVMQIPDDLLSNMSTHALVGSCLNFPAFGYITAYNNIQTGYMNLASKFNGLTELLKRNDAGKSLIEYYNIAGNEGFEPIQKELDQQFWTIKLTWIELLLAQDQVISTLEKADIKTLLSIADKKYTMKQLNVAFGNSSQSTALLIGRLLHSLNLPDFESEYTQDTSLREFLITSKFTNKLVIDKLIQLNQKYINVK